MNRSIVIFRIPSFGADCQMIQPNYDQTNRPAECGDNSFYVILHDAAPQFLKQIKTLVEAIHPLIGNKMSAAVVPCWHGRPLDRDDQDFIELVQTSFEQILLHGWTHRRERGFGFVTALTGACDEFNGLSRSETNDRLRTGQQTLARHFGGEARGFIAPTYQRGRADSKTLATHGLDFCVGFNAIHVSDGQKIPLATWIWDVSPIAWLGHVGHFVGHASRFLRPEALPCLAIHPVDVDRGFLDTIVHRVRCLLDDGRKPFVFDCK